MIIFNSALCEALPIFLDRISSPIISVILSVTVVLLFGEYAARPGWSDCFCVRLTPFVSLRIIPQAICRKHGLKFAGHLSWYEGVAIILRDVGLLKPCNRLIWFMIVIFLPIAWPLSKLLDFFFGEEVQLSDFFFCLWPCRSHPCSILLSIAGQS